MKLRSLLLIALVAVVFCGCHSYQPTSITVASYNLRNANGSDSAKGNGWGHFKCKDTGFEFLFFNLHMDHIGKKARVESAYLVQDKMKELGKGKELPAILTGDFNVDQTHQSYDAFVSKGVLCDSYEKCDFRYATNGTFNDFDPDSFTESRIDHVFVSPVFKVKRYGVLTDTYRSIRGNGGKKNATDCPEEIDIKAYQARTPSDHFPVKVELVFEGEEQK